PLAEPFTLGVSGGGALGATLAFVLGLRALSQYAVPCAALGGALLALGLVLLVSRSGDWCSESLLLSGVIVGTICASLLTYLLSIAQHEELAGVTWWLLGDLQGLDLRLLWPAAAYTLFALLLLRWRAGELNALALGEEQAYYLGVNARQLLFLLVLLASLLAAFAVCLAGIISFCGLIIPHIVRRVYGCDHRKIVFTAFFWGASFLLLCDLLSRSIFPAREIPIGVLTALVGGPIFLLLLKRGRHYAA
ncbi:MAG: iron ABC transporter permease, partial [Oligosphaeraceae bacterium]|nr:iron ABC transporter permease [Oligosphaeraceae bacterium]